MWEAEGRVAWEQQQASCFLAGAEAQKRTERDRNGTETDRNGNSVRQWQNPNGWFGGSGGGGIAAVGVLAASARGSLICGGRASTKVQWAVAA
eukprot:47200-Chlamydomonas_euryale.AAC.1